MTDEKPQKNPLGPTGQRVRDNVRYLREQRGLSYRQLADRLDRLGRPIPTLGLSRIENGARRVDADDLMALALALGVNPSRLLLPPTVRQESVDLTPGVSVTAGQAWTWADGAGPLLEARWPEATNALDDFERYARPGESHFIWRNTAYRAAADVADRVEAVLMEAKYDVTPRPEGERTRRRQDAIASLRRALTRLDAEVADLAASADGER